jgi:hypothetical protein
MSIFVPFDTIEGINPNFWQGDDWSTGVLIEIQ